MRTALEASPGERLRTLRDLLGLTGAALAEMSGVSATWISNVERGEREATEDKLRMIAESTETPLRFFSVAPSSVPLDSLRFRKMSTAKRSVTRRVTALYQEGFRVTEDITSSTRYPAPPLPYATENELGDEAIEYLAEQTRVALRLAPDKPIPHLTRALERSGIAVTPLVLPDPNGETASTTNRHFGMSYWAGIGEHALVAYFPGASGDRDRFTLAHELGHLVLHTFRPHATDAEGEANRFAGAFMVPYERAKEELTDRLTLENYARRKATWGVSIQALIMRAAAVGNLTESRKRSLYVQISQRGWRKEEPVEVGREHPLLLWTLLVREYGARPYLPASDQFAIQPAILRSLAPEPNRPTDRPASQEDNVVSLGDRRRQRPALKVL